MRTTRLGTVAAQIAIGFGLLALLVLPWAWYGDITIRLYRLPNWGLHLGAVLAFHAALLWTLRTAPGRRRVPVAAALVAGGAATGSAVLVALGYDNSSALFSGPVPMVVPRLGPGVLVAVLAVLVGFGAVAALGGRPADRKTGPAGAAAPGRAGSGAAG